MTQPVKFFTLFSMLLLMTTLVQAKTVDSKMTEAEQKAMIMQVMNNSNQAKSKLKQAKDQMPKMLQVMQSMESCLKNASSQVDADRCVEESSRLAKQFGLDDDEFSDNEDPLVWDNNTKEQILSELKEEIQRTEQIMPCIEKAENLMDMMKCNQGM